MGQGSGSSNSAPQIVDEEALSLTWKSKGKENRKTDGKKNLDMSKVKCFIYHKQGHFAQTGRRRATLMAGSVEVDEFSRSFDEAFFLIAPQVAIFSISTMEHLVILLDIRDSSRTYKRVDKASTLS